MIVRPAEPGDREELSRILNQIIAIGGTTAYEEPVSPDYFDPLTAPHSEKTFLHVAEVDGKILGFQWVEPLDPPDHDTGGIATFARPGGVQKGVGRALFAVTKQAARQAGYQAINAKIRADNSGGLTYYERMGFAPFAILENVPLKDGTPINREIKRLVLD